MARRRMARRAAPQRRLFWATYNVATTLGSNNRAAIGDMLSDFNADYGADLVGFTVTRIRGTISWGPAGQAAAPWGWYSVGIRKGNEKGMSIADTDEEQIALQPSQDPHGDWMYQRMTSAWVPSTQTGEGHDVQLAVQLGAWVNEIDIKAQRRLDELGDSLFYFVEQGPEQGTTNIHGRFRLLLKRP